MKSNDVFFQGEKFSLSTIPINEIQEDPTLALPFSQSNDALNPQGFPVQSFE